MKQFFDYSIHYRVWHDDSEEHAQQMASYLLSQLRPLLPAEPVQAALDLGCGMGFGVLALKKAGIRDVIGIDIDKSQIASARKKGLNVELVEDSASYLDANKARFGLILLQDVLEHNPVENQLPLLRSAYEALQPGGRLIVQVPNANSLLASRWRYIDFTHFNSFTEHSLRFLMLNAGFHQVKILPTGQPIRRPSLSPSFILSQSGRRQWRQWFIRWAWRQVLLSELGDKENIDEIPLTLNMLGKADKPFK
jgi:SAM-dependent methyltransferase